MKKYVLHLLLVAGLSPSVEVLAQSCPGLGSITLNVIAAPEPIIDGPAEICEGETATLSVTNGPFSAYAWSTGASTESITVNSGGTYTVTVTNASGCTGTASQTVTVNPIPIAGVNVQGSTQCGGSITLTAIPGFTSYVWSTGETTQAITFSQSGTYAVTVTDANGCSNDVSLPFTFQDSLNFVITGNTQICAGENTTLSATPGFNSYTWSNGNTGQSISVNSGGTYTVTVTGNANCVGIESVTVTEFPNPAPTLSGPNQICSGQNATISVNETYSSYLWSTGAATQSIITGTAGTYSVTVTTANGCTNTGSFTLAVDPSPAPQINAAPYQCDGQLTLDAGGGFSSYIWSNGQSVNPVTVSASGNYTVTVTAPNGCTAADAFFADIPADPLVNITGNSQYCEGESALLQATPGFNSYIWSNGQGGQSINVINPGTYSVTATDNFGCTDTESITVDELPAPTPTIDGPASICDNESATLTVPGAFSSYAWSNGANTQSINVSNSGAYTVTVTDGNGCSGASTTNLVVLAAPQPFISAAPYQCDGQLSLDAGAGPGSYLWSDGQTNNPISVTASGNYGVTVTASNGCTATDFFFADIPADPVVSISGNPTFCQGGSSLLTASGSPSAYQWSTGETGQSITVTQTGNYEVTATDGFGCTATDVFSVQALNNPAPNIAGPATICAGGSATFNVPGNFNTYAWSTGESTQSIIVSTAGTYTVTVTAANGCTGTDAQILSLSNSLEPEIAEQPYNCDGQIQIDAGAGFDTYAWSNGQNTQSITISAPGDYTVTVTDATGCSGTDLITITIPADPVVDISGTPAICQNSTAALSATPGLDNYLWSNGQVGPSITVNAAGAYSVTATDNFGCTATDTFVLSVNPLPNAAINGPATICQNSSGTLSAPPGLDAYIWSTGENTSAITVNAAGVYAVTVTDNNGCSNTGAATVTVATQLEPQISALPYDCDGQIGLDAGAGFSTYVWSSGQNTPSISAFASGDYTVTVTDATGCTGTDTISVTVPSLPVVGIAGDTVFCAGADAALNATPGFQSYAWSTGDNTASINTGNAGPVTVTVTDAFGCTATAVVQLTAQPLPSPVIAGPSAVCAGNTAVLSVDGSFAGISWSTGATTDSVTLNSAGTYSVTATDSEGCTGSATTDLVVNANPTPQITAEPYDCNGQIDLSADPSFVQYAWSTGENTNAVSAPSTGTYSVTVTDNNGCTGTASATVDVPDLTQVTIEGGQPFCPGGNTGLDAAPGFVSYAWSTGQTSADIQVDQSGTYSITATDANGCTSIASTEVIEWQAPTPVINGPATVCPGSNALLSTDPGYAAYSWSDGSTAASITVQAPITVSVTVTDSNGCTGTAEVTVDVSSVLTPVIAVQNDPCAGQAALDAGAGFDTYTWSDGSTDPTLLVQQSGSYSVTVTDGAGCTGSANTEVIISLANPVSISGDSAFCAGASAALSATAGFDQYLWSTGASSAAIVTSLPGTYGVTATDANGCTVEAFFPVQALPSPQPDILAPATLCTGGTAVLSTAQTFEAYAWSTGGSTPEIQIQQPGAYSLTVTDADGCTGEAAATVDLAPADITFAERISCDPANVGLDTVVYNAVTGCDSIVITQTILGAAFSASIEIDSDYNGFDVSCAGTSDGSATAIPQGGQAPFQYQWSNGATTATAANIGAGAYTLTVTDALGCSATITALLDAPEPVLPVVLAEGPTCSSPGAITVQSISGGVGPYTVQVSLETAVTNGNQVLIFDDLDEGTFTVVATDNNGCSAEEMVVLTPLEVVNEFVGDTIEIFPGETLTLNAPISITPVEISWIAPAVDLSCDDCLNPSLTPVRTTVLQLFVQGYGACTAEGRFLILVKTDKQVFIPNVISPESGDQNAWFTIYGDESLVNIRSLQVYDRWGGQMAVFQNIQPNQPEQGWDGTFRGDLMMPGVYVFWAEVEYADGTTEVFSGDVTVVR